MSKNIKGNGFNRKWQSRNDEKEQSTEQSNEAQSAADNSNNQSGGYKPWKRGGSQGFRGQRGSSRGRGGHAQPRTGFSASVGQKVDKENFPQPKYKSTSSADKNDRCSDFPVISSLGISIEDNVRPDFFLDLSNFVVQVESSYSTISAYDKNFEEQVSPAMYLYFCVVHFHRALLYSGEYYNVNANQANANAFHLLFDGLAINIPKDIAWYLEAIGDITDPDGHDAKLKAYMHLNDSGHFGRVATDNHLAYETLPTPFVALWRVYQDLKYTMAVNRKDENATPEWDLPSSIRPVPPTGAQMMPTANLLGWAPARMLTVRQRNAITAAGLSHNSDDLNIESSLMGVIINRSLLEYVNDRLKAVSNKIDAFTTFKRSRNGSQAQIVYSKLSPNDNRMNFFRIYGEREMISKHCGELSTNLVTAGVTLRLRKMRKQEESEHNLVSMCYVVKKTVTVPAVQAEGDRPEQPARTEDQYTSLAEWNENSDDIFNKAPERWNSIVGYSTGPVRGRDVSKSLSETSLKVTSKQEILTSNS